MGEITANYWDRSVRVLKTRPFVMTEHPYSKGLFRIEIVGVNRAKEDGEFLVGDPYMPPLFAYALRRAWGYPEGWLSKEDAEKLCCQLNDQPVRADDDKHGLERWPRYV